MHYLSSIYLQFISSYYLYVFRACLLPIIRRYLLYIYSNWYVLYCVYLLMMGSGYEGKM
jgi:hypothetical protein